MAAPALPRRRRPAGDARVRRRAVAARDALRPCSVYRVPVDHRPGGLRLGPVRRAGGGPAAAERGADGRAEDDRRILGRRPALRAPAGTLEPLRPIRLAPRPPRSDRAWPRSRRQALVRAHERHLRRGHLCLGQQVRVFVRPTDHRHPVPLPGQRGGRLGGPVPGNEADRRGDLAALPADDFPDAALPGVLLRPQQLQRGGRRDPQSLHRQRYLRSLRDPARRELESRARRGPTTCRDALVGDLQ